MPDISLCTNSKCPSRLKCYRFTAKPNPLWQVYGDFKFDPELGRCEAFYDNSYYSNEEGEDEEGY